MIQAVNLPRLLTILVLTQFMGAGLSAYAGEKAPAASDFQAIKLILDAKCAGCHSAEGYRPFSSKIPFWNYATGTHAGLSQKKYAIDDLLAQGAEASEGHLKMLEHVVKNKSMPPIQYRIMRPDKRLNSQERELILQWIYGLKPEWSLR